MYPAGPTLLAYLTHSAIVPTAGPTRLYYRRASKSMASVKSLVQRLNDGPNIGVHLTMSNASTANKRAFTWSFVEGKLALKIAR